MKKVIIVIVILFGILLAGFFLLNNRDIQVNEQVERVKQVITAESKTEAFVKKLANEYWEADVFSDFGARYKFMCDDVKKIVTKEKYIAKYKADLEERPLVKPEKVDIREVRIDDDTAIARVTVYTVFYTEGTSFTTELKYDNGKWCITVKEDTKKWLSE